VNAAYVGGVYSPTQNRIYFVPHRQGPQNDWHYINCISGEVVAYAHGLTPGDVVDFAYVGGAYSPTQNRIYFAPANQAAEPNWHYINCATGNVVADTHGLPFGTFAAGAYHGAVYSPTQNRIYFVPHSQSNALGGWHFINCADGTLLTYTKPSGLLANAYKGGAFSPTQNRIYFVPANQAPELNWHYIDCVSGNVVSYERGVSAITDAYSGGVFSPVQNRIYFVPYAQASELIWHYIDCSVSSGPNLVVEYGHGLAVLPRTEAFVGGTFDSTLNRIYFIPYIQSEEDVWHFLSVLSDARASKEMMAGPIFNKY
jgi:hypothetical protein